MKNTFSNRPNDQQVDELIKRMNMIFLAIIAGVIVFAGISVYLVEVEKRALISEIDETFRIVAPLLAVAGAFGSKFLYTMMIRKAASSPIQQKLTQYQAAMLVRLALLEGPALFSIVAYLLTGNHFYFIIIASLLALMLLQKPSRLRLEEEMFSTEN